MRRQLFFFTILLSAFSVSNVEAQVPLSFEVENTGESCNVSAGPLANNPNLPDPFSFNDGSRVSTFDDWTCRRNEIIADFETYELGEKPPRPSDITASYSGGELTVTVRENGRTLTITSSFSIPSGAGPHPIVIGMDGATGSLSSSLFSGVVQVPFTSSELATGTHTGTKNLNDPFYAFYPNLGNAGKYLAWSWGVSRLIDGLEIIAEDYNLDMSRVAVSGCSYAGKMALFAGALDERIALTIAQESGGGGINSWRTSQDFVSRTGTDVEKINNTNGSWFLSGLTSRDPYSLPHDHHELIAMIAPRAFLTLGNATYGDWLGDESGYKSTMAALEVWKAMGIEDRFGFDFSGGHEHCQAATSQNNAVRAFVNKFLKNDNSANTNIRVEPSRSDFDYNWQSSVNWTTPEISFNPNVPKVVLPELESVLVNETTTIEVEVEDQNNDVSKVEFFVNGSKMEEKSAAPYTFSFTPTETGSVEISFTATDAEGNTGTAKKNIMVRVPQGPYGGTAHPIPGTIQLEEYDVGGNGYAYFDDSPGSSVTPVVNFRTDEDVDIETSTDDGGGYNLGWTTAGEWTEYTVNVMQSGIYDIELRVACNGTGRAVNLSLDGNVLANAISIPNTGGWQAWETVTIPNISLTSGQKVLRLTIGDEDYVNLNYVTFVAQVVTEAPTVALTSPSEGTAFTTADIITLSANANDPDGTIAQVDFYSGSTFLGSVTESPFNFEWQNPTGGTHTITAVATDNNGVSTTSEAVSITVRVVGTPFSGTPVLIPGRIEAEAYDLGGEGIGFHEGNEDGNEGDSDYRNDEVDVELTQDSEGEYNVGYILNGEWLAYTIEVPQSGEYDLELRVATDGTGRSMHIELEDENISGPIAIPNTGGYQTWETVTVEGLSLEAGVQQIRLVFDANYMNLNYFEFKSDLITSLNETTIAETQLYPNPFGAVGFKIQAEKSTQYTLYDVSGKVLEQGTVQSEKNIGENLQAGMYLLQTLTPSGASKTFKITKK